MKRIFAVCILLLPLAILSCTGPSSPGSYNRAYITGKVMRSVISERLNDTTLFNEDKIQTQVLALYRQYTENGNSLTIDPDSIVPGDVMIPSPAKIRSDGKVSIYLYQYPDSAVGSLMQSVMGLDIEFGPFDSVRHIYQCWIPIMNLKNAASSLYVRHIAFIFDPVRWSAGTDAVHSAEAIEVASLPQNWNVKVGVISDDCGSLESEGLMQALKSNNVLGSNTTALIDNAEIRTHEGLAMMELVQQIAPNAEIIFATGTTGLAQFSQSIEQLAYRGCKIIVDDLLYLEEPAFSDGELSKTIKKLTDDLGIIYISSAGNFAKDVYSFTFRPVENVHYGNLPSPVLGTVHRDEVPYLNQEFRIVPGQAVQFTLQWDDAYGSSRNNFDLHLIDIATGIIVTSSVDIQGVGKNADPFEILYYEGNPCWGTSGYRMEIVRQGSVALFTNPTPRMKVMMLGLGDDPTNRTKSKSIFGHATDTNVIACAAMTAGGGMITAHDWSSRGDAEIILVNQPIDLATGQRRPDSFRQKPDLMGVDAIGTSVENYSVFSGTSAAAPVVAGIVAILIASEPTAPRAEILEALRQGCIDYDVEGNDPVVGIGRLDAFKAVARLKSIVRPTQFFSIFSSSRGDISATTLPTDAVIVPPGDGTSTIVNVHTLFVFDGYTGAAPVSVGIDLGGTSQTVMSSSAYSYVNMVVPGTHITSTLSSFSGLTPSGQWDLNYSTSSGAPPLRVREFGVFIRR